MKISEKSAIALFLSGTVGLSAFLGGYWTLKKEQISLIVKGEEIKVSTFNKTVEQILVENNIKYDEEDIISPSLETELKDYMKIKVVDVTTSQITENIEIPYKVKTVDDKNLLKGKTEVSQKGEVGNKELTYELTYHDGELVKTDLAKSHISKEPTEKVVKKGTKEEIIVASRSETSRNTSNSNARSQSASGKHMKVVATAYAGDTITSTGTVPKWGTIAVDPRVIPYGTRVYIPQFGMTFVAEDCGGAIKGNKIDIFMNSESQCRNWGRRSIDIYVK